MKSVMANYKLLKRLKSIMHLLEYYSGISKSDLIERLYSDYDIDITERTLERDFKNFNDEFGIEIKYSHTKKGYFIDKEASQEHLIAFFKFAELSSLAEVYKEGLKDFKSFQKWILPDDSLNFKGIDHIQTVLKAISANKTLLFTKENYQNKSFKDYEVVPLKLKEFENRWYLISVPVDILEIRNFGLDRISKLKIGHIHTIDVSKYDTKINAYNDIVGLNYSNYDDPITIELRATEQQIKYLRSLPLHHSQMCIINEGDQTGKVTYHLKPNYEFEIQILKLSHQVEVISPDFFRERIKNHIAHMHNIYN